jgi:hypothetical protein
LKAFVGLTLAASAAFAFAPTHFVVVDGAVLYDEDHNYEEEYILARVPYWTPVEAEPVGPLESPRTYCLVTLADGRHGLTEWDYLGRRLEVVAEEAALTAVAADVPADATRLRKGDLVAYAPAAEAASWAGFVEVLTAARLRGWVPEDALAPLPAEDGD